MDQINCSFEHFHLVGEDPLTNFNPRPPKLHGQRLFLGRHACVSLPPFSQVFSLLLGSLRFIIPALTPPPPRNFLLVLPELGGTTEKVLHVSEVTEGDSHGD